MRSDDTFPRYQAKYLAGPECLECTRLAADLARLTQENERLTAEAGVMDVAATLNVAELAQLRAELNAYRTAGLTVREDCAHEALAEAQVCGCGQRITERIRTVQGRGFGTADICQRCRGLQPCGCGHEADLHQRRLEALLEAERENTALRERLSTLDPSAGGFVCGD